MSVNQYGFPVVTCRRCAGTGSHGPSSVLGGRCFDCGGTGQRVRGGKASAAWTAFLDAHRKFRTPTVGNLAVGDRVRLNKGDDLRTVAAIRWEYLGEGAGSFRHGDVTGSQLRVRVYLTWEDGTIAEVVNGPHIMVASRAGKVDPAPFLDGIR